MVVVHHFDGSSEDPIVYGPFANADEAMRYATKRWGITAMWYWLPLNKPD